MPASGPWQRNAPDNMPSDRGCPPPRPEDLGIFNATLVEVGGALIDYRYTRHNVARGARPDAISGDTWHLFKNVSELRLTYQIRLLTFLAEERGARLIVRAPTATRLSGDLWSFVTANSPTLKIERVA